MDLQLILLTWCNFVYLNICTHAVWIICLCWKWYNAETSRAIYSSKVHPAPRWRVKYTIRLYTLQSLTAGRPQRLDTSCKQKRPSYLFSHPAFKTTIPYRISLRLYYVTGCWNGEGKRRISATLTTITLQIFKLLFEGNQTGGKLSNTLNYNITQRLRCWTSF